MENASNEMGAEEEKKWQLTMTNNHMTDKPHADNSRIHRSLIEEPPTLQISTMTL